jgi:hypothetical protein
LSRSLSAVADAPDSSSPQTPKKPVVREVNLTVVLDGKKLHVRVNKVRRNEVDLF